MKVIVENREYWLRAVSTADRQNSWPSDAVVVLVQFQAKHAIQYGLANQSDLRGSGISDIKYVPEFADDSLWSLEDANQYCKNQLIAYESEGWDQSSEYLEEIFLRHLQSGIAGVNIGATVFAPTGQLTQEIIIPKEVYIELISQSEIDLIAFRTLEQAAYQCIRTQLTDRQPTKFQVWMENLVTGKACVPNKQPKAWSLVIRNLLICSLVDRLEWHGITPTRNSATADKGKANSGFDIVAKSCTDVHIKGISSYETVKGIYYKSKS